jgi:hypothetical protein
MVSLPISLLVKNGGVEMSDWCQEAVPFGRDISQATNTSHPCHLKFLAAPWTKGERKQVKLFLIFHVTQYIKSIIISSTQNSRSVTYAFFFPRSLQHPTCKLHLQRNSVETRHNPSAHDPLLWQVTLRWGAQPWGPSNLEFRSQSLKDYALIAAKR